MSQSTVWTYTVNLIVDDDSGAVKAVVSSEAGTIATFDQQPHVNPALAAAIGDACCRDLVRENWGEDSGAWERLTSMPDEPIHLYSSLTRQHYLVTGVYTSDDAANARMAANPDEALFAELGGFRVVAKRNGHTSDADALRKRKGLTR